MNEHIYSDPGRSFVPRAGAAGVDGAAGAVFLQTGTYLTLSLTLTIMLTLLTLTVTVRVTLTIATLLTLILGTVVNMAPHHHHHHHFFNKTVVKTSRIACNR